MQLHVDARQPEPTRSLRRTAWRDAPGMEPENARTRRRAVPRSLPNVLTWFRIGVLPLLWALALLDESLWLGIGLAIAALTDVADGAIARRYRLTSAPGSRLDSIADHLLTASTALWIVRLRPEFVNAQLPLLAAWLALGLTALGLGWLRFRRLGDLHLYSAKLAGMLGYLFAIGLLLSGTYSPTVFYIVIGTCIVASLESLLVLATRSRVDEHIGSVLRYGGVRRASRRAPGGESVEGP